MKSVVKVLWIVTPCNVAVGYQQFGGPCCWGVKLTTHLHLVPRLRMCQAIHPFPHVFMVWCLV